MKKIKQLYAYWLLKKRRPFDALRVMPEDPIVLFWLNMDISFLKSPENDSYFLYKACVLARLGKYEDCLELLKNSDLDQTKKMRSVVRYCIVQRLSAAHYSEVLDYLDDLCYDNPQLQAAVELHFTKKTRIPLQDVSLRCQQYQQAGEIEPFLQQWQQIFLEEGLEPVPLEKNKVSISLSHLSFRLQKTSKNPTLVSVIVSAYNAEETLEMSLKSLLNQTHQALEIIVIDDSSTDATLKIAKRIAKEHPQIQIIENEKNSGTYRSRNAGIKLAKGDFITTHDSDDWAHPQKIEMHLKEHAHLPSNVVTYSQMLKINKEGKLLSPYIFPLKRKNTSSLFFPRHVLEALGSYKETRVGSDIEMELRVKARYGYGNIRSIKKTLTLAGHHEDSLTNTKASSIFTQEGCYYRNQQLEKTIRKIIATK